MKIDGVEIKIVGLHGMNHDEIKNYIDYVRGRVDGTLMTLEICDVGNDEVNLNWTAQGEKFERIRRITGYLVGTTDRWNNAKQAEERQRVKHDVRGKYQCVE